MDNATDALFIAFAVFIFVIALTISITMFSQANQVSQAVLTTSDITNFYNYEFGGENQQSRIVGLETIIPTLYKYYKENYTILFLNKDGTPLSLYDSQTNRELWGSGSDPETNINPNSGIIAKYYTANKNNYIGPGKWNNLYDKKDVCSFDVDEETIRHEPWTGVKSDFKKNLDAFLYGGIFYYPSGATDEDGNLIAYNYGNKMRGGFIGKYSNARFKEILGEYTYSLVEEDDTGEESNQNALLKNRKKRVIIYQLQEQ